MEALYMTLWIASIVSSLIVLSVADSVFTGRGVPNKRKTMELQLDLFDRLYEYEQKESDAERQVLYFLRALAYTKIQIQMCEALNNSLSASNAIDDAIISTAVLYHRISSSEESLPRFVEDWLRVEINTYYDVPLSQVQNGIKKLEIPTIPHKKDGIVSALKKVEETMESLKFNLS